MIAAVQREKGAVRDSPVGMTRPPGGAGGALAKPRPPAGFRGLRPRRSIVGLALLLTVLLPTVACMQSDAEMSSAALKEELTDRVFHYVGQENGVQLTGQIVYRSNGSILIRTLKGYLDGGTWRTEDENFCTRITLFRKSNKKCFTVTALPDGSYSTSHGFRLKPLKGQGFPGV